MRIVKVGESYICPVCGKYTFEYAGDFDICPVCNWEDDLCQLENPDEEDCANHMSLNQAREAWAHGRRVDEWEDVFCTEDQNAFREIRGVAHKGHLHAR